MVALVERPVREAPESIDGRLQQNLRRLRREHGMTLDVLSRRAGVSRAMISKIERGTAIPTATILGKLSAAFGIGLSQFVGDTRPRYPVLLPQIEQVIYRDPESGLERRSLSPLFPDRSVDFVLNILPAGRRVVFPGHHQGVEEYLFVSRGELIVVADGQCYSVRQGSTLFYPGHSVHEFRNNTDQEVEFFILIDDTRSR
ncbi:MAG TPA: XRE family transcriptional regulator [Rhodopila sp.]